MNAGKLYLLLDILNSLQGIVEAADQTPHVRRVGEDLIEAQDMIRRELADADDDAVSTFDGWDVD